MVQQEGHWHTPRVRHMPVPPATTSNMEPFHTMPTEQEDVHLATWKREDTIPQQARWGPATPPADGVRRLMRQPEIKGAVLRGAVPVELH